MEEYDDDENDNDVAVTKTTTTTTTSSVKKPVSPPKLVAAPVSPVPTTQVLPSPRTQKPAAAVIVPPPVTPPVAAATTTNKRNTMNNADPFTDDKINDLLSALDDLPSEKQQQEEEAKAPIVQPPPQQQQPQRSYSTTTTTKSTTTSTSNINITALLEVKIVFTSIPANAEHPFEVLRGTQCIYKTDQEISSTKLVAVKLQIPKPADNMLTLHIRAPLIGVDAERPFDIVSKGCFIRLAIDADDSGEKMFTISQRSDDAFPYVHVLLLQVTHI